MPTIGSKKFIGNTLHENKLKAKKKLGQNFLTDITALENIAEAGDIDKYTLVIEVGPGLGSLTEQLVKRAGLVLAYELDQDLIPILKDNLGNPSNLIVKNIDILKADVNKDILEYKDKYSKVHLVANIPYYITTPIILGLLSQTKLITKYVLMIQLEVADRITSKPKTKDYNALSIAIGYRCKAEKLFKVPRTAFIPAPNVDSAVISLDLYETPIYSAKNEELFFKMIREAFAQRRKTLVNNLGPIYGKDKVTSSLLKLGFKLTIRSEELSIEDFVNLSDLLGE